jgi:hypothetical protein
MKTPEKEYFANFLAETPTGVYNNYSAKQEIHRA